MNRKSTCIVELQDYQIIVKKNVYKRFKLERTN